MFQDVTSLSKTSDGQNIQVRWKEPELHNIGMGKSHSNWHFKRLIRRDSLNSSPMLKGFHLKCIKNHNFCNYYSALSMTQYTKDI
jgi:hypothetical protein